MSIVEKGLRAALVGGLIIGAGALGKNLTSGRGENGAGNYRTVLPVSLKNAEIMPPTPTPEPTPVTGAIESYVNSLNKTNEVSKVVNGKTFYSEVRESSSSPIVLSLAAGYIDQYIDFLSKDGASYGFDKLIVISAASKSEVPAEVKMIPYESNGQKVANYGIGEYSSQGKIVRVVVMAPADTGRYGDTSAVKGDLGSEIASEAIVGREMADRPDNITVQQFNDIKAQYPTFQKSFDITAKAA